MESLELEIAAWRSFVGQAPAVAGRDVEELEAHLRDQIADLHAVGLAEDEAFLVAVKRMGTVDDLAREFAREHSGRLWRQLVVPRAEDADATGAWLTAIGFAFAAALTVQVARLAAAVPDETPSWLWRNAGLFVLPFLAAWFAHRRRLSTRASRGAAATLVAVAVVVNVYPFDSGATTEALVAAHLPVVVWFVVAFAAMSGEWRSHERRMDVVRFTGEWCIYYALIALGGGVLMALTTAILEPTAIDPERVVEWVVPSGAAGAVVIAAWLVESKQRVIENMAPVLTMLFTPLFAAMLALAAIVYAITGLGGTFDRELLGVFDALLVVVLGLVLYGISAREPNPEPSWMDRIQLVAIASALVLDAMVLASMAARIGELGFTPNRTAALGLNLVLLVNLAVTAWLAAGFLAGRRPFHRIERWQTAYLPVFGAWALAVVVALPLAFGFD